MLLLCILLLCGCCCCCCFTAVVAAAVVVFAAVAFEMFVFYALTAAFVDAVVAAVLQLLWLL